MDKLYTRKETARILGVSLTTLDTARLTGEIEYIQHKVGGNVYFTSSAIEDYVERFSKKVEESIAPKHSGRSMYRHYLAEHHSEEKIEQGQGIAGRAVTVVSGMPVVFPRIMTLKAVANTGILPEYTLRRLARANKLPAIKSGNKYLINLDKLIDMLERLGDHYLEI